MNFPLQNAAAGAASMVGANHDVWLRLYESATPAARQAVAQIVQEHAAALARDFYDTLLADEQAARLISHDLVAHRLNNSLQSWLRALLGVPDTFDVAFLIELQQRVGEVHARLAVSVPLVSSGARILKTRISEYLRASDLPRDDLSLAQQYMAGLFDIALEVMSAAYMHNTRRGVRADEAYRLFSLGQNVAAERERQRAALLEWGQCVLLLTHRQGHAVELPPIRNSEFGLWMHHKGSAMFDGTSEMPSILAAMFRLDGAVLKAVGVAVAAGDSEAVSREIQLFQREVDDIKYLLMTLFDRVTSLEGGRDPLTQLLNRRFLPTVLAKEISMATAGNGTFSIFMADIDYFKRINDNHGHASGDAVLRQVAELLQDTCRAGDYVFRYGGEEFLVVLVDAQVEVLERISEKLRAAVERRRFRLPDGDSLAVTISIGGASFDGHPDPDMLVDRADKALYAAKAGGRNSWQLG